MARDNYSYFKIAHTQSESRENSMSIGIYHTSLQFVDKVVWNSACFSGLYILKFNISLKSKTLTPQVYCIINLNMKITEIKESVTFQREKK